jgi:glyoxylase-like metal-dependent hydrolase (beta-lactamase superfamily II)
MNDRAMTAREVRPPVLPWNPFARARPGTEVVPGVYALGSQRVNFYAVVHGRRVTLIDCGFYGHRRYLDRWLRETGRWVSDVEAVVITHGHADHLGFAATLSDVGVPVFVPRGDLEKARTTAVRPPPERLKRRIFHPGCLALVFEATCDFVQLQPAVERAVGYAPNEVLDVGGGLRPIAVPGHSPGNCALVSESLGAAFTGDSLMTLDPMFGETGPVVFSEDPARDAECLASLARLAPFGEMALLPAHGEPWTAPGSLRAAIAQARISGRPPGAAP